MQLHTYIMIMAIFLIWLPIKHYRLVIEKSALSLMKPVTLKGELINLITIKESQSK